MAEPLPQPKPESIKPPQIIVGETPIYFTSPQKIGDIDVSSFIINDTNHRGIEGINSAVIITAEPSRKKGEHGILQPKANLNLDPGAPFDWDKITGIQWQDAGGNIKIIPKEQLSLSPAEEPKKVLEAPKEKVNESLVARDVLSTLTEDPNTITIMGLKAYETRALDLADKSIQRPVTPSQKMRYEGIRAELEEIKDVLTVLKDIPRKVWKESVGGIYFHERARQYYMDMLTAAQTPFAEDAITMAESRAQKKYQDMLASDKFKALGTKIQDWFNDNLGRRTTIQKFALDEIAAMKTAGEIKGMDTFEREAKAVRLRFGADFDKADQFIRKNLGEKLEILDTTKEEHKPLVEGIHTLLKKYATEEGMTKQDFDRESQEFFKTTLKSTRPDIMAEAELYSSSLFDTAEALRAKASHIGGIENIDQALAGMQIRLGLGTMGEVTGVEPNAVKKGVERVREIADWLNKKNILVPAVFNEATIGSGVAIALSLGVLPKTILSASARAAGGFAGGILAGGTFAGFREYSQIQKDYLTHMRERESGASFGDNMKRRAWMEKFMIHQRNADEIMANLQKPIDTTENIRLAMATVADVAARKAVSETGPKRIGLIQFASRDNIESQRTALDVLANKKIDELEHFFQDHPDHEALGGNEFSAFMEKLTVSQTHVLREGVGTLDSLDNPVKETLGLVAEFSPEAAIINRKWTFAASELGTEAKALGIEAILGEFRKEAFIESIKYGARAGAIGAATGAAIHGLFELNSAIHTAIGENINETATQIPHAGVTSGHSTFQNTAMPLPEQIPAEPIPVAPSIPDVVVTPPETITYVAPEMTISAKQIGTGGMWDYFMKQVHTTDTNETIAATNGLKNLWRLHEVYGVEKNSNGDPINITFTEPAYHHSVQFRDATFSGTPVKDIGILANDVQIKLPESMFGASGIERFGQLSDEAIQQFHNGEKLDELHQAVLNMGYIGKDARLNEHDYEIVMNAFKQTPEIAVVKDVVSAPTVDAPVAIIDAVGKPEATPIVAETIIHHKAETLPVQEVPQEKFSESFIRHNIDPSELKSSLELPWFPIFLPNRRALEKSAPEPSKQFAEGTLLSPYGEAGYLSKTDIDARKSPKLVQNPEAILVQQEEINSYISQLSDTDRHTLTDLSAQYEKPLSPGINSVVMIPVTGASATIYQHLAQYNAPKTTELVVYDINPSAENSTKLEVDRFIQDNPDTQVVYITNAYPETLTSGQVKRDLSNFVLNRMTTHDTDVILINDPGQDTIVTPTYISSVLSTMEDPVVEFVSGKYPTNPGPAHQTEALFDEVVRASELNGIPNIYSGNNAVRASILAAVGGYNARAAQGEDRELAHLIRSARTREKVFAAPADMNATWAQVVDTTIPTEQIPTVITQLYETRYPDLKNTKPERFTTYFTKTLDTLGITHEMQDGKLVILDANNVVTPENIETAAKNILLDINTPRETLESLAGTPETPVAQVSQDLPITEGLSSPEITPIEGVENKLTKALTLAKDLQNASIEVSSTELMDYLKSSVTIDSARITGGAIVMGERAARIQDMKVQFRGGEGTITANLIMDVDRGLIVDPNSVTMQLPMLTKIFSSSVKDTVTKLPDQLKKQLNNKVDPAWQTTRLDAAGATFRIQFTKK